MTAANSYIAIDVETTGLAPGRDKILEIAALYVEEGKIRDRFVTLIQPCRPIAPEITRLTGITDDLVREAPEVEAVIGELVKFCGELPLLGHNISFDYSFLQQAAVNAGLKLPANVLDTLGLCRSFMPAGEPKNLGAACAWYGISQTEAHRAQADAVSAHLLYQKLLGQYGMERPELFAPRPLEIRVKREQPATKRQKDYLRDLSKYHRINVTVQIDSLSRSEASRMIDQIISQYGRMTKKVNAE